MRQNGVNCLVMGGQACVFYGAAEFSRDLDLVIAAETVSMDLLSKALTMLKASIIAVPDFELRHLEEGHALHFRCQGEGTEGLRIDVMSKLRGLDPFPKLWERRTTATMPNGPDVDLLSLPDLVTAKKTQRDKDWPMITRLVDSNYFSHKDSPKPEHLAFWLRELRTPAILREVAMQHPQKAASLMPLRPCLSAAISGDIPELRRALREEEDVERAADEHYWQPLKLELEAARRKRNRSEA